MDKPRILFFDIETRPMLAEVWGMFDQNIGLNQVREFGSTICVGAKWSDSKEVMFFSDWQHGHRGMLEAIHALWSEADAICGYNNNKFDNKKLQGEFLKEGMPPPPPASSIDLYLTVRGQFGFDSNKLDHVASLLGLGNKLKHDGHTLWSSVLQGCPKAQAKMERYCKQDVRLTERVYHKLRPYIRNHPHLGYTSPVACGACGSYRTQKRGVRRTKASIIERIQCQNCGSWLDGRRSKAIQECL